LVVSSEKWDESLKSYDLVSEVKEVSYLDKVQTLSFDVTSDFYSLSDASFTSRIGKSFDIEGNAYLYRLNAITKGESETVDKEISELVKNDVGFRNSVSVAQTFIAHKIEQAMSEVDEDLL